jgi:hypothetical protein
MQTSARAVNLKRMPVSRAENAVDGDNRAASILNGSAEGSRL